MHSPRWLLCVLAALAVAPAACGRLKVKSVQNGPPLSTELQGEWSGTWQSSGSTGSGEITLHVQEFGGKPVVTIQVANSCLVPQEYDIVVNGRSFALQKDGVVILQADLDATRKLVGSFQCAADAGTWQAVWQRDLPAILDLSGEWRGTVAAAASPATPLVLTLNEAVRGAQISIDGALELLGLLPGTLPVLGSAHFGDGTFDMLLTTPVGVSPAVQIAGLGDSATLSIGEGLFAATPGPLLPFTNALWSVVWVQR